jgi:glycosyltransferase involved in cell wall biosynthesis
MRVGILYLDALAPGGYPRDVRWVAGHLSQAGVDVSLFTHPGAHRESLDDVEILRPDQLASTAGRLDLIHLWGIFIPQQLWLARRVARTTPIVFSPMGHLIAAHLRRRWWKKAPYLAAIRPVVSRWRPVAHLFSAVERPGANRFLRPVMDFEATLGVFPASGAAARDVDEEGDYILFFGRNDVYQKGIDLLLKGYALARKRSLDLPLRIAGQPAGNSTAVLRRHVADLDLSGHVTVLGSVTDSQKWGLLKSARCLAFLSRWDGPPRPIREALAVGTPVMVTPGTNLASLVAEASAGIVVDPRPEDIAQGLEEAASDANTSAWRHGAVRLRDELSWPAVVERYVAGYESTLRELGGEKTQR